MDFSEQVTKLILDNLRQVIPAEAGKLKPDNFIDRSTSPMGFSRITKRGFTP